MFGSSSGCSLPLLTFLGSGGCGVTVWSKWKSRARCSVGREGMAIVTKLRFQGAEIWYSWIMVQIMIKGDLRDADSTITYCQLPWGERGESQEAL